MKWLVDAQLPPRLCTWLKQRGEESLHVYSLSEGLNFSDDFLWKYARENSFIIISKDNDFFERSLLFGAPPQTVFLSVGNCSIQQLLNILDSHWNEITYLLQQQHSLLVISKTKVQVY
jgi:predicted nuclease of predicted toxin-antitoxin system